MATQTSIIKGFRSDDPNTVDRATRKADKLLGNDDKILMKEDELKITASRTVINHAAFKTLGDTKQQEMSPDAFMKSVEEDAKRRAKDRQLRKKVSDGLLKKGNKHFHDKEYEKALSAYNKAIDEIRDSCLLYTNRALTYLHLELYDKVLKDCELALKLNENSLKALLYKSRALYWFGEEKEAERTVKKAMEIHPQHTDYIKDYESRWERPLE